LRPLGLNNVICAFGATPVTYTCSALPLALNGAAAVAAGDAAASPSAADNALSTRKRPCRSPIVTGQLFHTGAVTALVGGAVRAA
jgi:hypothetical protein